MRFTDNPPRTIMEVFKMLPEGTLAELIDGSIYMSPSTFANHQRTVGKLYIALSAHIERINLGEIFISPFDVYLDELANAVQPDLIFIAADNSSLVQNDAIHGVPDMLLEILSPGNSRHDLVRKKELYERFGVKEYWIINPDTREVTGFLLKAGKYGDALQLTAKIKSALLQHEFDF
jgi:Uma2 family endonuclease